MIFFLMWIYLIPKKSEVPNIISHFSKMVHTQFQTSIKIIWFDNGEEFIILKDFFLKKKTLIKLPFSTLLNKIIVLNERKHHTILT